MPTHTHSTTGLQMAHFRSDLRFLVGLFGLPKRFRMRKPYF